MRKLLLSSVVFLFRQLGDGAADPQTVPMKGA